MSMLEMNIPISAVPEVARTLASPWELFFREDVVKLSLPNKPGLKERIDTILQRYLP